jgi:hypothetical protein
VCESSAAVIFEYIKPEDMVFSAELNFFEREMPFLEKNPEVRGWEGL